MGNRRYRISKKSLLEIICAVYLFCMIYQSGSVPAALQLDNSLVPITRAGLLIIPIFCFRNIHDIKKLQYVIFFGLIGLAINWCVYPEGVVSLSYKFILLIFFFVAISYFERKKINVNHILYLDIIAIIYLTFIFYIIIEVLKFGIPYVYVRGEGTYWYRSYVGLFFSYHNGLFPRLSGLFWEPGMYAIILNIALFLYIFKENSKKKSELFIILVSIVFCQSAAGYCIGALLIIIYIYRNIKTDRNSKYSIAFISALFSVAIITFIIIQKRNTNINNQAAYSYGLRVSDIVNGIKVFSTSPLWGVGYGNTDPFSKLDLFGRGSSNGLVSWLYMTGIIGTLYILIPFINNIIKCPKGKQRNVRLFWLFIVLVFNMSEPIYSLPLMTYILACELKYRLSRKEVIGVANGIIEKYS